MKFFKRTMALIMSATMVMGLVTGCNNAATEEDTTKVLDINGNVVTMTEYRYYYENIKAQLDGGNASYWEGTESKSEDGTVTTTKEDDAKAKQNTLKEYVLEYLKSFYTIPVLAEKNNITFEKADQEKADKLYDEVIENFGGKDAFKTALEESYCTEALYKKLVENSVLQEKVLTTLYGDQMKEDLKNNYVRASHILLMTNTPEYDKKEYPENATDEQKKEVDEENAKLREEALNKLKIDQRAKAEEILEKAKNGEDFDSLITEYNEDPGMTLNDEKYYDGYYFTKGTMVQEFEDAAFALNEGEVSDIIETTFGYHIIKRLPMEEKYIENNLVQFIQDSEYYQDFYDKATETLEGLTVTFEDIYDTINIDTFADNTTDDKTTEENKTEDTNSGETKSN